MLNQSSIDRIINRVGELPAMPAVVSDVLRLTDDPNVDMSKVSQVIEGDPGLAAKILQVSNSSYYGMKQFVGSLKLALVILGVREVRNIVLGISVFETLKDKRADLQIVQQVWDESLELASICKRLTNLLQALTQGEEFVGGLLANIGKMVLLRELADEYKNIYELHRTSPELLLEAELEELGYTHADAAMALCVKWSLPQSIADAMWYQYPNPSRPLDKAHDPTVAALVRICRLAQADMLGPVDPPRVEVEQEAWAVLQQVKAPLPQASRVPALRLLIEEVRRTPSVPV